MLPLFDRPVSESPPNARFLAECGAEGCSGRKELGRQYFMEKAGDVAPSSVVKRMRCTERRRDGRVCGSAMTPHVWFYEKKVFEVIPPGFMT